MLTFAEEILVLLLGNREGELFTDVPGDNLSCALAGAVLLDLSFAGRVDTDPEQLMVVDATPTGNVILDGTLAQLAARDPQVSTRAWIAELSVAGAPRIRESVMESLVARNILAPREGPFRWSDFFSRPRAGGSEAERQVKRRIREVLFSDDIPAPRNIALVGLTDACDLIGYVLSDDDVNRCRLRLDQFRKLDLIARELSELLAGIEHHVTSIRLG